MFRMSRDIGVAILMLSTVSISPGQAKEPFYYSFAVVSYSCSQPDSSTSINVYSQVFGACLSEANHQHIAHDQLYSAEQVAKTRCQGGDLKYQSIDADRPLLGAEAQALAEKDRAVWIKGNIGAGIIVENFYIAPVYSKKCR
jgi:hypothetical protein